MSELISLLMPAYNHEKYIQEAIQALINQTYENLELIIVDDGSTDSTYEKILEMKEACEKRFKRFVVEKQQNKGVCDTLNKLLSFVQGEYIFSTSSDDIVAFDTIKVLHDFLTKNEEYVLVVGQNLIIDADGVECYWDKDRNIVYSKEEATYLSFTDWLMKIANHVDFYSDDFGSYESLLVGNYLPNGFLLKKSVYDKIGPFRKEAPLEDYFFAFQIAKLGKMKFIDYPTFYYRWHGCNTILQTKKMQKIYEQTRKYEFKLVEKSKDKRFKALVKQYKNASYGNPKFIIPNIFEIYEDKNNNRFLIKILTAKTYIKLKR